MTLKKIFFFTLLSVCCFFYGAKLSHSVKIVAVVNDGVITDYDVEEFEKILCVFDKRFRCGTNESKQMSLLGLIESTLKLEHFKQFDFGADKNGIMKGFEEYKDQILKNIKKSEKNVAKSFIDYLYSEYIWNMMISSQVRQEKIKPENLKEFAEKYNIKNVEPMQLQNMYMQYRMNEVSQQTMTELKKFYLIDIKGL